MLKNMEFTEGVHVFTADGQQVGKISRFVVDPATNEVTHIVVQKGWLLPEDKVVALQMVSAATEEKVVLSVDMDDFDHLPPFEEEYFVRTADDDMRAAGYATSKNFPAYCWYPPQGYPGYPTFTLDYHPMSTMVTTRRNTPEETIPLKDGANIISADGEHVGNIERLFIEPGFNRATHLVIKYGTLFKERKLIPTHWVKSVEEDKVYLNVSSQLLDSLPSYDE